MPRDLARSTRVTVVSDAAHLAGPVARWIALETIAAIRERGACALGLSGGRTPEPVYRELASAPGIDWSRVSVFFGDERAVPPDDRESNYRMVREALLTRVPIPDSNVHRMEAERPGPGGGRPRVRAFAPTRARRSAPRHRAGRAHRVALSRARRRRTSGGDWCCR